MRGVRAGRPVLLSVRRESALTRAHACTLSCVTRLVMNCEWLIMGLPGVQRGEDLEGRSGIVWKMYAVKRWTQERIARELGVSQQRVSQILKDVRAAIPAPDKAEMILKSIEAHHHVIAELHALAERNGAPVTAGKDGTIVLDPDDQSVVRDWSLHVNVYRALLVAEAELRKLMGLDAATKTESTATVRYVLEGVNTDDLA